MQKLFLAVALSVALIGSASAARPAQLTNSVCSLPEKWDQADYAPQAFASMNGACPSAAGQQTEDDDTCVPCVCGAYQLFSDALDHPIIRSDSRSKMSSPLSVSLFGEIFHSCIEENAKKFINPMQIQMGLNDCLSSTDAPIKNGAQLAALCASWIAQSEDTNNEAQDIQSNEVHHEADDTVSLLPADAIPEVHVVEERVRSMLHESRIMQEAETSAEASTESSEESSGEYFFPPPGAAYPPTYPPTYPAVYPPTPSRDINFSPPPPPGSAAGVTVSGMMPLLMALVSAFLMATMMI